ncbi:MAG: type I DNA topoisomerase [Chloroflexi bacterium]|nr:type I DNA topoisomerase [Chloroflexota bacterium]
MTKAATNLVIVESPAKAQTIERYLGPDYTVLASYGHIRDLPQKTKKGSMAVDVENGFTPVYEIIEEKQKRLDDITRAAKKASAVWLATDLDREGEAIAWHVAEALGIPDAERHRVTFSEITKGAILEAFAHPRAINLDLVNAQQARRILDRLVGYRLSPLLSRLVKPKLSAGRVQSVALRLVVERERAIRAFIPRHYTTVEIGIRPALAPEMTVPATLIGAKGEVLELDPEAAAAAVTRLTGADAVVTERSESTRKQRPVPPFTTSTLQQEAGRKHGFRSRVTMQLAQKLYEGVEIGGERTGLITYMRTDSPTLSQQAISDAAVVIRERFGPEMLVEGGRQYASKSKSAQEAHEAIRPTNLALTPELAAPYLDDRELKVYTLIWRRTIASQMPDKLSASTTLIWNAGSDRLKTVATRTLEPGFTAVYLEGRDDEEEDAEAKVPDLPEGSSGTVATVEGVPHATKPEPRFTEPTLVKELEKHGIGRPSTYAAIIERIQEREYVDRDKENRLRATRLGETVCDLLTTHFATFVDLGFTAGMEEDLDAVAEGRANWREVLQKFWSTFDPLVLEKAQSIGAGEFRNRASDEKCSEGHPMEERLGRFGWYLACTLYPEHAERKSLSKVVGDDSPSGDAPTLEGAGLPCPVCGAEHGGVMAQRRSRFGWFLGCSRYPECKYIPKAEVPAEFKLEFEALCPVCGVEHGGKLGPKKNNKRGTYFYSCDRYPECKTIRPRPTGATHAECGAVIGRDDEGGICTRCGARVDLPVEVTVGAVIGGGVPDPLAWAPKRPRRGGSGATDGKATRATSATSKVKIKSKSKGKSKTKAKEKAASRTSGGSGSHDQDSGGITTAGGPPADQAESA